MSELKVIPFEKIFVPIAKAVVHNGVAYLSGSVGFKPGTLEPISDDIGEQARETFRQLEIGLKEAGSSINNLIMVRVYLTNARRDFAALNEEYARWVGDHRPARTTVEAQLAIEGLLIEVDCIAAVDAT